MTLSNVELEKFEYYIKSYDRKLLYIRLMNYMIMFIIVLILLVNAVQGYTIIPDTDLENKSLTYCSLNNATEEEVIICMDFVNELQNTIAVNTSVFDNKAQIDILNENFENLKIDLENEIDSLDNRMIDDFTEFDLLKIDVTESINSIKDNFVEKDSLSEKLKEVFNDNKGSLKDIIIEELDEQYNHEQMKLDHEFRMASLEANRTVTKDTAPAEIVSNPVNVITSDKIEESNESFIDKYLPYIMVVGVVRIIIGKRYYDDKKKEALREKKTDSLGDKDSPF